MIVDNDPQKVRGMQISGERAPQAEGAAHANALGQAVPGICRETSVAGVESAKGRAVRDEVKCNGAGWVEQKFWAFQTTVRALF